MTQGSNLTSPALAGRASLVAHLPMQETPVRFLGLGRSPGERDRLPTPVFLGRSGVSDGKESACNAGDPLEKGMATLFSILAWKIPMDGGAWWATVHRVTESDTTEQLIGHN